MTQKGIHITLLTGTRPNLVKAYALLQGIERHNLSMPNIPIIPRHIYTGQHYDDELYRDMLRDLNMSLPDVDLNVGGGSSRLQKIKIYTALQKELILNRPDFFVVFGDVNSTLVGAICADYFHIPVVHIESGLRSFDMAMPEEFNRIQTDKISKWHFTTLESGTQNLINEGYPRAQIFQVGNLMIDTLIDKKRQCNPPYFWESCRLQKEKYFLLTIHRQSNVSSPDRLIFILDKIILNSQNTTILFPAHPFTHQMLQSYGYTHKRLILTKALPYLSFLYVMMHAKGIITDSGGISEESSHLNIPCITLRSNTERPETISMGTNMLCDEQLDCLPKYMDLILSNRWKQAQTIPMWDGKAGDRIVKKLLEMGV